MGISAVAVTFKWMSFITRNFNAVLAHQVSENNKKNFIKIIITSSTLGRSFVETGVDPLNTVL
jgi:hypothetical protein